MRVLFLLLISAGTVFAQVDANNFVTIVQNPSEPLQSTLTFSQQITGTTVTVTVEQMREFATTVPPDETADIVPYNLFRLNQGAGTVYLGGPIGREFQTQEFVDIVNGDRSIVDRSVTIGYDRARDLAERIDSLILDKESRREQVRRNLMQVNSIIQGDINELQTFYSRLQEVIRPVTPTPVPTGEPTPTPTPVDLGDTRFDLGFLQMYVERQGTPQWYPQPSPTPVP